MDWTGRLRIRTLEMLLSLAQTRTISRSAEAFNTTQPAMSKWLRDLELEVGTVLFERHARGLRPTAHGELLIAHARRIVAHLHAARDDLAAMSNSGSGRIAIGTSGASAGSSTPLAVLRLLERHPTAAFELIEGPMDRLLERLGAGEIDVAVGRPAPHPEYPPLHSAALYEDPIVFIARSGHPLFGREELAWNDLLDYRWILWPKGTPTRDALDERLAATDRAVPPLSIQSGTATLNLTLIANSDLICLASQRDAQRYIGWNIVRELPVEVPGVAEVAMYWRSDGDTRPLLTAMLDCLREAARV
jgi:DNA-binding transcriptional LysR family regulator